MEGGESHNSNPNISTLSSNGPKPIFLELRGWVALDHRGGPLPPPIRILSTTYAYFSFSFIQLECCRKGQFLNERISICKAQQFPEEGHAIAVLSFVLHSLGAASHSTRSQERHLAINGNHCGESRSGVEHRWKLVGQDLDVGWTRDHSRGHGHGDPLWGGNGGGGRGGRRNRRLGGELCPYRFLGTLGNDSVETGNGRFGLGSEVEENERHSPRQT